MNLIDDYTQVEKHSQGLQEIYPHSSHQIKSNIRKQNTRVPSQRNPNIAHFHLNTTYNTSGINPKGWSGIHTPIRKECHL